jgi:hypothetical protein
MFRRSLFLKLVALTLSAVLVLPASAADTLEPSDFTLKSWDKTIDFFDYVRAYAEQHGKKPPSEDSHAFLHLTYVNVSGIQMLYAGLENITLNQTALSIPIQTCMMHYRSRDDLKDVVTASSFVMLLAFSEDVNTIHEQSPDRNDTLYASFSLGCDLAEHFPGAAIPRLISTTEIIPLESTDDLTWTWGMRYTNLTAIWWETSIDPGKPRHDPRPVAISMYDELTFTYSLTLDPETGEAKLSMNYVIGRMIDLWVIWWLILIPIPLHYNSTGCYGVGGKAKLSDETIYDFLQNQGISMSIVQFQSTVVLDHTTYSRSNGVNVTDKDVAVDDSKVSTFAGDGERIFDADFSVKKAYQLFNYTADSTETDFASYDTTTRTCKVAGYARNPIFKVHTFLMRFIPLVVAHMDPELYQQAKERLLDMSYADYFYVIAYQVYDGYRIEHDPTYTAYCSLTTEEPSGPTDESAIPTKGGLVLIVGLAAVAAVAYVILRRRR